MASVDGGGNVPPELGVVRRLVERGHLVTVLAEDSVADEVRGTGATLRRWLRAPNRPDRRPEHDPARDWECRYPWQMVARLTSRLFVGPAAAYAADVGAVIGDARPNLVICSMFCLGGMVAAEAAGIPFDVVLPNVYLLPAPGLPPFGLGLQPARGILGRLRDRALTAFGTRLWDHHGLAALNDVRASHYLPPLQHLFDQVHLARRQLVLTARTFEFPAAFPSNVRYVGPILDDPAWARAGPWTPPPGEGPLILVAMSTTFQDQVGSLQRVIDALGGLPVRGLVTTGPALEPSALTSTPNVTVVSSAPHSRVLQHASVVITHGGHGTVMKALAAGIPLLILPHGRDQADTAARVTSRGAGIVLRSSARPAAIAAAIRQLLQHDRYPAAARALGDAVRREADTEALLRELETI
jgi:UDP:flavonoid glycosyltransferase YjiC (YdhE family)